MKNSENNMEGIAYILHLLEDMSTHGCQIFICSDVSLLVRYSYLKSGLKYIIKNKCSCLMHICELQVGWVTSV